MKTIYLSLIQFLLVTLSLHAQYDEPFSTSYSYSSFSSCPGCESLYEPYFGNEVYKPYAEYASDYLSYSSQTATLRSSSNQWLQIPYGDEENAISIMAPIGDGVWVLLFVLMVYSGVVYYRRRKKVYNE